MRRFQRTAFAIGALVTLLVLGADLSGLFRWMEDWTLDLRFRHARWERDPLGDQIRLVGIDDASLDSIGRWPWPRARLAGAVEEVARAGARVMAFDVLFTEPESGTVGDARLARAMSGRGGVGGPAGPATRTVLALNVVLERSLQARWDTPKGRDALERLTRGCRGGIDRPIETILDEGKVVEPWRSLILDRPNAFKSLAAWNALMEDERAGRPPADLEAFVRAMQGGLARDRHMGDFSERRLLEEAWQRLQSWREVERRLRQDPGARGSLQDTPPIPEMAMAASSFGVVNAETDRFDGRLRRVKPFFPTDHGWAPHLGVASALAFLGHSSSEPLVRDGALTLDGRTWPLLGDRLPIDWPTELLQGYGDGGDGPLAVIRIGRLVELADKREQLERQKQRQFEAAADLVLHSDVLAELRDRWPEAHRDGQARKAIIERWYEQDYGDEYLRTQLAMQAGGPLARGRAMAEWVRLRQAIDDLAEMGQTRPTVTELQLRHAAIPRERDAAALMAEFLKLDRAIPAGQAAIAAEEAVLRDIFSDRLVFFGFTATGTMADMVSTIFDPRTPGVFAHVVVADMILNGRGLFFVPAWVAPLAIVILGLTAAVVAARFGAGAGFVALVALLAVYAGVLGVVVFDRGEIVFPMAAPVSAGLLSWICATADVAILDRREKRRISKQFRARVSSQLVDLLTENPKALSMEGVERETSILFGDLAGFTTISERLGGPEVVKTLNLYMGAMTRELTLEHAYVNKFLGDGLLAFWSAFAPEPRQREYAVRAAIQCQRLVKEIGERPDRAGLPPITLRLGIATGKVVIGDCGAPPDLNDYTVIGDAVNLASRLESANKQFGTSILVDGHTAEGAGAAGLPLLRLGRVVVVGQSVPVEVAEVCMEADPSERIRMTEAAVQAFARCDHEAARRLFGELEARFGSSKTAHAFLDAMDNPADLRDGVLRLRAK